MVAHMGNHMYNNMDDRMGDVHKGNHEGDRMGDVHKGNHIGLPLQMKRMKPLVIWLVHINPLPQMNIFVGKKS